MVAPPRQGAIPSGGEVAALFPGAEPIRGPGQLLAAPGPPSCLPAKTCQGWAGVWGGSGRANYIVVKQRQEV